MAALEDTSKITEINSIDEEIKSLERGMRSAYAGIDHERVSTFRYFWPFLVASFIEGFGGYVFSCIDAFLRSSRHEEYHAIQNTQMIVIFLIFLALHIFGGMFARYMANKKNRYLELEENYRIAEIKKNEKKIIELKIQKKELLDEIPAEKTLVETDVNDSDSYTDKVAELNRIGQTIAEQNIELCKIRVETSLPKRDTTFYFWPFLLVSWLIIIPLMLHLMIVLNDYSGLIPLLISAHFFALIHILGGIFARRMTARYNQRTEEKNASLLEKLRGLQDDLADLEIEKKQLLEQLKGFEDMVPEI